MDVIKLADVKCGFSGSVNVSDSETGTHFNFPVFVLFLPFTYDSYVNYLVISLISIFLVVA